MTRYSPPMAVPRIKATYSLDVESIQALEDLARRWGVAKSEALRRAIRAAVDAGRGEESDALRAFNELQEALALSPADAKAWAHRVRAERRASGARSARSKV